ncbi:MAG: glycosyltransferase [Pleurocapsa sp.]
MSKPRIAFFLPTLHGGGAERVSINLLKGMLPYELDLDLVLGSAEGPYLDQIPKGVNTINLGVSRVIKGLIPLRNYLNTVQPTALLSHMGHTNVVAILAKATAKTNTKLVVVEHNTLSASDSQLWRAKLVPWFMKRLYPLADGIVGVSQGVSDDLEIELGLKKGAVTTIYNPVIDRELLAKANTPVEHPWLQPNEPPVFLAVGRLTLQKDFANLIKAFALVRQEKAARLMILGEGELRGELETLAKNLGVAEDVALPGFVNNPYGFMNQAEVFTLSSQWEGLPTALIEAMACGCSVVATDCPSGPREILQSGKYGQLVPVGDSSALATGMLKALTHPASQDDLKARSRYFSTEQIVPQYLDLLIN